MILNDNARKPDKPGALESIAGKPAPTGIARTFVGAGLPAMVVNDNACGLDKRGALESIASKLAPTAHRQQAGSYRYCAVGVSRNCVKNLFYRYQTAACHH
jgi:hypothetical protein